jgi:hypothetical protein
MSKTLLITVILFLFGFAPGLKLNAQPIFSQTDLETNLRSYDEAMRKNPPDVETARRIRNGIVNYVQGLVNENYEKYADELYKNRNRQSISVSVSDYVTGIDTDTKPNSIADSDCAKKTVSACFLGSVTAEPITSANKKSARKKPSKELSVEILLLAMEISRTQIAAEIEEKLKLDVNQYPLEFARRDLRSYFFAGTPIGAARGLGLILERMKK